jgi:hypothetical protein
MSDPVKDGKPADGESFLSRWSRRKVEEKSTAVPTAPVVLETENPSTGAPSGAKMPGAPLPERTLPPDNEPAPPLPDIESLTHEADFSPFMAKEVDPALRNQAMKKLFADPHYRFDNMDKLDIYIDDYSVSTPIPLEILKQMYQSKALALFDDEEEDDKKTGEAKTPVAPAATVAGDVPVADAGGVSQPNLPSPSPLSPTVQPSTPAAPLVADAAPEPGVLPGERPK